MNKTTTCLRSLFCLLVLLSNSLVSNAQSPASVSSVPSSQKLQLLPSYIQKYTQFSQDYTQEKVYLHFDNESYFIGENIWFKAYVVLAENNAYTNMSKTLYVELLSQNGNLVNSLKLKIENGQAHGVFYLNNEMSAGFYEVRAYTRCMLNFGEDAIFSRVFPVMDLPTHHPKTGSLLIPSMTPRRSALPDKRPETIKSKKGIVIDFYPEGGHLVENITNNVAFKAYLPNDSIFLSGGIYDSHNQLVSVFSVIHDGMGFFEFLPLKGENYTCRYTYKEKEFECPLPTIQPEGYVLQVNNIPLQETEIYIIPSPTLPDDTLALAIACRGRIYAYRPFRITSQGFAYRFSKQNLPSGVNQAILYNSAGQILAERMFFVKNPVVDPQNIHIRYAQDQPSYKPFEPIRLKINVSEEKDSIKQPLECCFSLAVRDANQEMKVSDHDNIYSHLLLTSDLKGYINNPGYYFNNEDARHLRALDLLMMVQGWKRYDWDIMTGQKKIEFKHPIEEGILLQGKVLSIIKRNPKEDINVLMWMISDSSSYRGNCQTDSSGAFNFLLDFEDKWKLSLQITDNGKRKNYFITINRQFSPPAKRLSNDEMRPPIYRAERNEGIERLFRNDEIDRSDIKIMPGDVLLPEAEIKGKKKGSDIPVDVSITYQAAEEMDKLEDNAESTYSDIPTFLTQVNPNFWLNYDSSGREILYYKSAPVTFCDMFTRRVVSSDSNNMPLVDQIEKIEIIEPGTSSAVITQLFDEITDFDIHSSMKNKAYVMLTRYKDGHRDIDPVGIRHTVLQGYQKCKDFYHPHYDKILLPDPNDHRRTLYWNPDLKTNASGQADIRFYNNCSSKQLVVDTEILTPDGKMGYLH